MDGSDTYIDSYRQSLSACRVDLLQFIDDTNANPILIRLAWHDSGTFDASSTLEFPKRGGATASIRFMPEIGHGANAGLNKALSLLQPFKENYPMLSWADIIQMASALSVEHAGGPKISMRYGRIDAASPEDCTPDGRLPSAEPPFPAADSAQGHLRNVFYRMGLDDKDIVALSGAHTLGRAHSDRSGFGASMTKYTSPENVVRADGKPGIGSKAGGTSWTPNWLQFDNSYFKLLKNQSEMDPELLALSTDKVLFADEVFRTFAEKYADDQDVFFVDYAEAHRKLSELGAMFFPVDGIVI